MFVFTVLIIISSLSMRVTANQNVQLYERVQNLEDRLERQEALNLQLQVMLRHQGERNIAQDAIIKQQQEELVELQENRRRCENENVKLDTKEKPKKRYNMTSVSRSNKKFGPLARVNRELLERVAFSSFLDHDLTHLGIDHPIVYNQVLLNEGPAYSEKLGVFTCPMDGLYVFYFSVSTNGVNQVVAKLVVDGNNYVDAISDTFHPYHEAQGGNLVVLSLNAGQQVWVANYRWVDKSMQDSTQIDFPHSLDFYSIKMTFCKVCISYF